MYKQCKPVFEGTEVTSVIRTTDGFCIPFAPDNTDYQRFKKDLETGAELQDAEGTVMTSEQIQQFIATLP